METGTNEEICAVSSRTGVAEASVGARKEGRSCEVQCVGLMHGMR